MSWFVLLFFPCPLPGWPLTQNTFACQLPILHTISEPLTTARDAKRELISQLGNTPLIELVDLCSVNQSKDVLFAVLHLINEVTFFFIFFLLSFPFLDSMLSIFQTDHEG